MAPDNDNHSHTGRQGDAGERELTEPPTEPADLPTELADLLTELPTEPSESLLQPTQGIKRKEWRDHANEAFALKAKNRAR